MSNSQGIEEQAQTQKLTPATATLAATAVMAALAPKQTENRLMETLLDYDDSRLEGEQKSAIRKDMRRESAVLCPEHDLPLNFWCEKEAIYKCIKCLINEKEVHFVDHSYKG